MKYEYVSIIFPAGNMPLLEIAAPIPFSAVHLSDEAKISATCKLLIDTLGEINERIKKDEEPLAKGTRFIVASHNVENAREGKSE